MSTTSVGKEAEKLVAAELRAQKHKILAQNWRTRRCKIDIVSSHKGVAYIVEVKYRGSQAFGSGFDYIGSRKLKQMAYAAET